MPGVGARHALGASIQPPPFQLLPQPGWQAQPLVLHDRPKETLGALHRRRRRAQALSRGTNGACSARRCPYHRYRRPPRHVWAGVLSAVRWRGRRVCLLRSQWGLLQPVHAANLPRVPEHHWSARRSVFLPQPRVCDVRAQVALAAILAGATLASAFAFTLTSAGADAAVVVLEQAYIRRRLPQL